MSKGDVKATRIPRYHDSDSKKSTNIQVKPQDPKLTSDSAFQNLRDKIQVQFSSLTKQNPARAANAAKSNVQSRKGPSVQAQETRGKKRNRNGIVVTSTEPQPAQLQIDTGSDLEDESVLEREIKALGGTSEDLELIADAESDSELEGDANAKAKVVGKGRTQDIQKGISNILKEIALSQGIKDSAQSSIDLSDKEEDEGDVPNSYDPSAPQDSTTKPSKTGSVAKLNGLKCDVRPDWYATGDINFEEKRMPKYTPSQTMIQDLYTYAKSLLDKENTTFWNAQQSSSSQAFYNTVISSGTLSDKISALTLAVQESPLHNMKALENLIGLSKKRSRSQAVDVLRALKDLFAQGSLLPADRRLYTFSTQPGLLAAFGNTKTWITGDPLPKGLRDQQLIVWAFEHWLKEQYFEILKTLEVWCNDEIEFSKARAVSYVFELLRERSEQESNLLRLLVNKLGDPIKKIASQASYLLMQLLTTHPAMKTVVVSAIETDFIFRPGQSLHGKYYATVTLNQTALSSKEEEVAVKLLNIYFGLFTDLLKTTYDSKTDPENLVSSKGRVKHNKKKVTESGQAQIEELTEKLTSAVLTGVNRAYPYTGSDQQTFNLHLDTLFRIAHSANFNTSIQAMLLIQQLSSSRQSSSDRFYRILYESLLDPRLIHASKQQLYLNLIHRALKTDLNMKRVKAFVKRLLQILSLHEPPFICAAFFLLKDLEKSYPALTALTDQAEDHETDEEVFRDVGDDNQEQTQITEDGTAFPTHQYDAHKRAPEHANAENSCAWEVLPYLAHFHPSVSVSADHYMRHVKLPGKADLTLHTLAHFLDRFAYRNAKLSSSKPRGSSVMQPMATDNSHAVLIYPGIGGVHRLPVNSEEFRDKKDTEVGVEDVFFHKYFAALGKDANKKVKKREQRDMDNEDSADEDAVWKAMLDSAPDLEGEGSEDDLSMSDLESDVGDISEEETNITDVEDDDADEGIDIEAGIFDESEDDIVDMAEFNDTEDLENIEAPERKSVGKNSESGSSKGKTVKNEQRKKMRSLPVFASADDYARMLNDDEDEDLN